MTTDCISPFLENVDESKKVFDMAEWTKRRPNESHDAFGMRLLAGPEECEKLNNNNINLFVPPPCEINNSQLEVGGNTMPPPPNVEPIKEITKDDQKSQAKKWCFTSHLKEKPVWNKDKMGYLIYQKEIAPQTGREHWQGYVQMLSKCGYKKVQEALEIKNSHVERQMAKDDKKAIEYCRKDDTAVKGTRFEAGEPMKPGKRTDLTEFKKKVDEGLSMKELYEFDLNTAWRNQRAIKEYKSHMIPERTWQSEIEVVNGVSGTSKTTTMKELYPDAFVKLVNSKGWWDGYAGQPVIIIDELKVSNWDMEDLLQLLDKGKYQGQTKGGFINICPRKIIITTNENPEFWDFRLVRRVHKWSAFDEVYAGLDEESVRARYRKPWLDKGIDLRKVGQVMKTANDLQPGDIKPKDITPYQFQMLELLKEYDTVIPAVAPAEAEKPADIKSVEQMYEENEGTYIDSDDEEDVEACYRGCSHYNCENTEIERNRINDVIMELRHDRDDEKRERD